MKTETGGRTYERGKAPAPPPPSVNIASGHPHIVGASAPSNDIVAGPKAIVVYDYTKKDSQEMSLAKSQIVTVLESKRGSEWWKVQDTIGRRGYYPAHYLKMI